jgi:hypothetical protein
MSGWELGTWAAIVGLTFGSIAVFLWFLGDAIKLFRQRRGRKTG